MKHSEHIQQHPEGKIFSPSVSVSSLLEGAPRRTNYLSTFNLSELTKPLSLSEEEQLANELVQNIFQQEKEKDDRYKLPEHLEQIKRLLDPPNKVKKKLPIISQLSPRTKNKIATLPKPNDFELQEVRNIEKLSKKVGGQLVYDEIAKKRPVSRLDPLASKKLDLLTDDETMELQVGNVILDPQVKLFIPNIVPNDKTSVSVKDSTTSFFKQAERHKSHKHKQNEILKQLLGPDNEDDFSSADKVDQTSSSENLIPFQQKPPSSAAGSDSKNRKAQQLLPMSSSSAKTPQFPQNFLGSSTLPVYSLLKQPQQQVNPRERQDYLNAFSAKVYDEIGLHLNKEYNRNRRYRQSLRVFFYYFYHFRSQAGFSHWKEITRKIRIATMQKAAWTMVSALRRLVYYRFRERKLHYENIQKSQEQQRFLQNQIFLKHNALIIYRALYRHWKMKKIKSSLREKRSTVHIQKGIRGFIARRKVLKKLQFINFLKQNATVIQCMYRRHLADRRVETIIYSDSFAFLIIYFLHP
jgi:hypothetical protein